MPSSSSSQRSDHPYTSISPSDLAKISKLTITSMNTSPALMQPPLHNYGSTSVASPRPPFQPYRNQRLCNQRRNYYNNRLPPLYPGRRLDRRGWNLARRNLNPYFSPYSKQQFYPGKSNAGYSQEQYVPYYGKKGYQIPYAPPKNHRDTSLNPGYTPSMNHGNTPSMINYTPMNPVQAATMDYQPHYLKDKMGELAKQIEYYFSDKNLVKDQYLKYQMDNNGWVKIETIAAFPGVVNLKPHIDMIKDALEFSDVVEIQGDLMRKRHGWETWILPKFSLVTGVANLKLDG